MKFYLSKFKDDHRPTSSLNPNKLPKGGSDLVNIQTLSPLAPNRRMSQVFSSWVGLAGTAYVILSGATPDLIGEIVEAGLDYVVVKIPNNNPLRYVPYVSIIEFWFAPLDNVV